MLYIVGWIVIGVLIRFLLWRFWKFDDPINRNEYVGDVVFSLLVVAIWPAFLVGLISYWVENKRSK